MGQNRRLSTNSDFVITRRALQALGSGSVSIQEAAGQGDLATLKSLLASGTAADNRDGSGCAALHFAADRGQLEAAKLLVAAGADVNAVDDEQQTPLHYAAMCGHEEVSNGDLQVPCSCYKTL